MKGGFKVKKIGVWIVVISLIVSGFIGVPRGYVSAENDSFIKVEKWSSMPDGAFLIRFEKDYLGISHEQSPLYVAAKQNGNTVIYKLSSPNEKPVKVLTIKGTYGFFDFDPAYNGYIFVMIGDRYGDKLDIYKNGKKINEFTEAQKMLGISHYKNKIVTANYQGVLSLTYLSGKWKISNVLNYGSLMGSSWWDEGIVFNGYGEFAWYSAGNVYGLNNIGEYKVESIFIDGKEIYAALYSIDTGKRGIYKITSSGKYHIDYDITNKNVVKALFKIDDMFILYQGDALLTENNMVFNHVVSPIFHSGKIWFIGNDGIYTVYKNNPLQVSIKPHNFNMDLIQVEKEKPYLEIVNKESQPLYVECKSDQTWLKPSWEGALKIDVSAGGGAEGGEAEKTEFDVILTSPGGAGLFDHYPDTPTTGATVSCRVYTADQSKEENYIYHFELKLPQLKFQKLIDGIVYDGTKNEFGVIKIVNKGMGTATLSCKVDKDWAEVECPGVIAPGKEVTATLRVEPPMMEKSTATDTITIRIGPIIWARDYHFSVQRTDIPDIHLSIEGLTQVEYEEMSSWHPVLRIDNMGYVDASVNCSSNMDWMLPDVFSVDVKSGSTATMSLMPRQSRIDEHWPDSGRVEGYYTCEVSYAGGTYQMKSPTLTVLLPQIEVNPMYTYDIQVSEKGGKITIANIKNTGMGYANLSYEAEPNTISLEYPSRLNPGEEGQLKAIIPAGKGELMLNINGKYGYKGSFHVIYTSEAPEVRVIQTTFTIPMLVKNAAAGGPYAHAISNIDDYAIDVEDEDGNPINFIDVKRVEEKDASGSTVTYGDLIFNKKYLNPEDIKLPETKVVLVLKYKGKVVKKVPITIKVNSALRLLVPKNHMEGIFYRWDRGKGWYKKDASENNLGAPFIHPKYWRTYVPLRLVSQELGLKVKWDGKERKITLEGEEEIIVMDMKKMKKQVVNLFGKKETIYESVNRKVEIYTKHDWTTGYGRSVYVDPSIIYRGRTYVPVRFIAEEIKSLVIWDGTTRSVWIYR